MSSSKDRTVRVWDLWHSVPPLSPSPSSSTASSWYPCAIGLGNGHTEGVGCVTLSSRLSSYEEGRAAVFSASGDKIIKRWDLHSLLKGRSSINGTPKPTKGGKAVVARLAEGSETGSGTEEIVTGLEGLALSVKQTTPMADTAPASLACSHSMRGHDKDINCVSLSPNDALLASGSQDKTIKLWNAADLTAVATLRGHKRGK